MRILHLHSNYLDMLNCHGYVFSFNLPDIYSTILPPEKENDLWKPYHFRWIRNIGTSIIKSNIGIEDKPSRNSAENI